MNGEEYWWNAQGTEEYFRVDGETGWDQGLYVPPEPKYCKEIIDLGETLKEGIKNRNVKVAVYGGCGFAWGEAIDEEEDEQARHTKCCITCLGFNDDDKGLTKDEVKTGIQKHVEHYISNDDEAIFVVNEPNDYTKNHNPEIFE